MTVLGKLALPGETRAHFSPEMDFILPKFSLCNLATFFLRPEAVLKHILKCKSPLFLSSLMFPCIQADASLLLTITASSSRIQERPITSQSFCLFLLPLLLNRWAVFNEAENQQRHQQRLHSRGEYFAFNCVLDGRRWICLGAGAVQVLRLCSSQSGPRLWLVNASEDSTLV